MTDTTDAAAATVPTLVDLIDELVEPAPPDPISMVPQTAGWAIVAGIGIALILFALLRMRARHRANAYRRAALAQLAQPHPKAADVATTLRRTALAAFPRAEVAGLTGSDWIAFLQRTGDGPLSPQVADELVTAPYLAPVVTASPALTDFAATWVRSHAPEGAK
ncbi:DUF4381 domain-containing protein [Tropicimonas sp. S265A]|uniref:DUF4381 domain-containing protein n=1 Tax=Tropicimonas sp. S265A TaxID=3415134 RepID=UPI003C7994E4